MPTIRSEPVGQKRTCVFDRGVLIVLCVIVLLLAQTTNLIFPAKFQQYRYLAESFLAGRLDFLERPGTSWGDTSFYNNKYFWPLGPFPAVVLIPLVWTWRLFGETPQQGYVNFLLVAWTSYLIFRLAKVFRQSNEYAGWLALAFVSSSSYLSMALVPWSWHLSHVIAVLLSLLAIHEYLGRRRWQVIGLLVALTFASRQTAGLTAIGFAALLLTSDRRSADKIIDVIRFTIPLAAVTSLLFCYNYIRYDSPFEDGYNYQLVLKPDGPLLGLWNLWPNLLVFLFNTPIGTDHLPYFTADPYGMSIAIVSPWLLFLRPRKWAYLDTLLAINIAIITVLFLLWWSTGSNQLGYRFSLDFMPLLFWLILRTDALRFTALMKTVIALSAICNIYFLTTVFNG
jgi:hypothetical protein